MKQYSLIHKYLAPTILSENWMKFNIELAHQ